MSDSGFQRSSLTESLAVARQSAARANPGISIAERPFLGYLNLRAEPATELTELIERASGVSLPAEANTFTESDSAIALWIGPDEWLLVTPQGGEMGLMRAIHAAASDRFYTLTDITHGNTTIRVHGPKAAQMLSKGCSLDLSQSNLREGSCAQTLLAKANVVIRIVDKSPSFDFIVRRSFAEYLALWLVDASLEYGFEIGR